MEVIPKSKYNLNIESEREYWIINVINILIKKKFLLFKNTFIYFSYSLRIIHM